MYEKDENARDILENEEIAEENTEGCTDVTEETVTAEEEIPVAPPVNRYTCFSDGSNKNTCQPPQQPIYSPNGSLYGYSQSSAAPKASKTSKVLITVSLVLAAAIIVVGGIFAWKHLPDWTDFDAFDVDADSSINIEGGSDQINKFFDESIPDVVTVSPIPDEHYDSLVELYNNCAPSCVSIVCTVEYSYGFYNQEGQSLGSGFVVEGTDPETKEKECYIVTNHHVIDGAKDIKVKLYDGSIHEATLIGSDEMTDIAVLTIEVDDLVPLEFADSDYLMVGQWVVAIGTPSDIEFAGTMSYGIISGIKRNLDITNSYGSVVKTMTVIQTTATLNPGNSGGPLINMSGQVVGINAMKLTQDFEGMGFALPATSATTVINSLITYGEVVDRTDSFVVGPAKLGITGGTVTDEIREEYKLGEDCPDGVLVTNIQRNAAAYKAGLNIYDIITEFNGKEITTIEGLQAALKEAGAGTKVTLTFYRPGIESENGTYHDISFTTDSAS